MSDNTQTVVENPMTGIAAPEGVNSTAQVSVVREAQEVQAMMFVAKQFPRNMVTATDRIIQSCSVPKLAEGALYSYARGGANITGPSIRLAEALAQNWGNIDYGVKELENKNGESQVMAYAWDLETNTRVQKVFSVKHRRHTRNGGYALEDPRDIYEMVANQGSRRLRACILGVIPSHVIETAVEQCNLTLVNTADISKDSIKKMLSVFSEKGVKKEHIEKRIQRRIDAITPAQFVNLRNIHTSIKDGMSEVGDWFDMSANIELPTDEKEEDK